MMKIRGISNLLADAQWSSISVAFGRSPSSKWVASQSTSQLTITLAAGDSAGVYGHRTRLRLARP
jgi:hypothetical protein